MDGYNGFKGYNGYGTQGDMDDDASSVKLPKWVWVVAVVGLAFAILCGYYTGVSAVAYFNMITEELIVSDTNGESTELNTLDFSDFLGVYDDYYGYNKFDAGLFTLMYDSSALYDNTLGTYKNDFTNSKSAQINVSFRNLSYYDVSYVYEGDGTKLSYAVEFDLKKGNMEAVVLRLDRNYTVKVDEYGISNIEMQYIQILQRVNDDKVSSITMDEGGIYMIVFAGESATGNYSLDVDIS